MGNGSRKDTGVDGVSSAFLARIIEHVAHPIFVKDRQFRFVLVNPALCEMVGHTCDQLLGKTDYDFFPKPEADFFRAKDVELFKTEAKVFIEEEPITDAEGSKRYLSTTKVPLRDESGEVTHLVGIISDITKIREAEGILRQNSEELQAKVLERTEALRAAQEELMRKERLAVLGQLAGGLAHQIRNPLGAVMNAAYFIQRGLRQRENKDLSQAVDIILEECQSANRTITDLLDYARVRPPQARLVRPRDLVEKAIRAQFVPSGVSIQADIEDLPSVAVDEGQVRGALENVLRNAIEALASGGLVVISGRAEPDAVVITVADTGPGIAEHVRARLFEPLVTTKPLGLGLGLITARTLIENQGGTLECVRSDKRGTLFEIRLPAHHRDG